MDQIESNRWWDLQTLGPTFSKGHLVANTRGSINRVGTAQSKHPRAYDECVSEEFGLVLPQGKVNPFMGLFLHKDLSSLGG